MESDEESGSKDIPYYLEKLADWINNPDDDLNKVSMLWVIDSGTLGWDRLWVTSSLRGHIHFNLKVEVGK